MSSDSKSTNNAAAESLCLACGLCCNGVIFVDVKLHPKDDAQRLRELGLPLVACRPQNQRFHKTRNSKSENLPLLKQPCAAFDGCRCRIYADRPHYCREFECALLKRVKKGDITPDQGLRVIRIARERADKVKRFLRELGDTGEHVALTARFRRTTKRLEVANLDAETTHIYGQLTLAMHDLNCLLSESFYPG